MNFPELKIGASPVQNMRILMSAARYIYDTYGSHHDNGELMGGIASGKMKTFKQEVESFRHRRIATMLTPGGPLRSVANNTVQGQVLLTYFRGDDIRFSYLTYRGQDALGKTLVAEGLELVTDRRSTSFNLVGTPADINGKSRLIPTSIGDQNPSMLQDAHERLLAFTDQLDQNYPEKLAKVIPFVPRTPDSTQ